MEQQCSNLSEITSLKTLEVLAEEIRKADSIFAMTPNITLCSQTNKDKNFQFLHQTKVLIT